MKYDVIAYCWNDALAGFTQEDARRLTHVNLAFGLIKGGLLDLHLLKYLHLLPKLREWNPEMKIVLSVGGWGADGFSHMGHDGGRTPEFCPVLPGRGGKIRSGRHRH